MGTYIEHILSYLSLSCTPSMIASMEDYPRSTLLGLPPELRLHIYDYMSLWPTPEERANWRGAYFTCHIMHTEMREHSKLKKEVEDNVNYMRAIHTKGTSTNIIPDFTLQSLELFGLLHGITLVLPMPTSDDPFLMGILKPVYQLYLDNVTLIWNIDENWPRRRSIGDLKGLSRSVLMNYISIGKVNCKKVTVSISQLANAEGGREKSTDLPMNEGDVPYTVTIVQDRDERQVEKIFFSPTRFKALAN